MNAGSAVAGRAWEIFSRHIDSQRRRIDQIMAGLLVGQWVCGILIALLYSPYAWAGRTRTVHSHVYAAIFLGALIASLPIVLAAMKPGARLTRYVIASAQMLFSALLIHLTGGRIETHFHIFGSLAFLAFYRDWTVLVPATLVVCADHGLRQLFWPQSVYGVSNPESWRFVEHAFWVVFEDIFLVFACLRGIAELRSVAEKQAELEESTRAEHAKSAALDVALQDALAARAAAEGANRVKGQFLANMSHELRTPINGVIGMTDLVSRTELSSKQRQYVETIRSSGETLLAVVSDILDFSKIEAGKLSLDEADLKLHDIVYEVSDRLAAAAHGKGLELLCVVDPDVPELLRGDGERLKQVLSNLIANAVKFTTAGEVVVRVRKADETTGDALCRFEVTDTGIGIAEADLPKLFMAFSQVDNTNSRKYGGTGLGLAITKQLVELMGGEIGAQSQLGKGSRFFFTLRFKKPRPNHQELQLPDQLRACRVLVVDDNATNRQILEEQIGPWVAAVISVDCGRAGLETLAKHAARGKPFGLVITDMQMPEMDGIQFSKQIRASALVKDLPIIMLTSVSALYAEEVTQGGVTCCLTKPVRPNRLRESMINALLQRPAPEEVQTPPPRAKAPRRQGSQVRLLLAEDNVVNQQVALEMLEELGYQADVVADGKQAVEALTQRPYTVVLMDCQMPEMNGYEATRHIRMREGGPAGGKRVPIIAVTADAMLGDLDKALAAGMDDYLAKPLTLAKLTNVLQRWLPRVDGSSSSNEHAPIPADLDPILDPSVKISKRVTELLLAQLPIANQRLQQTIAVRDLPSIKQEAHRLKGSCLSVGAERLAKLCLQLEASPQVASDFAKVLDQEVAALIGALEIELRRRVEAAPRAEVGMVDA